MRDDPTPERSRSTHHRFPPRARNARRASYREIRLAIDGSPATLARRRERSLGTRSVGTLGNCSRASHRGSGFAWLYGNTVCLKVPEPRSICAGRISHAIPKTAKASYTRTARLLCRQAHGAPTHRSAEDPSKEAGPARTGLAVGHHAEAHTPNRDLYC